MYFALIKGDKREREQVGGGQRAEGLILIGHIKKEESIHGNKFCGE